MVRLNKALWMVLAAVLLVLAGVAGSQVAPEPKSDFRFSIVGDRSGGPMPQIYGRVWREIDLLHPDFVINVGDTIAGYDEARLEADWQEVLPVWRRYQRYPLYLVAGNHDIWSEKSQAMYLREVGRPAHYSFNYQGAHFTVLDNSLPTPKGQGLNEQQLRFLEEDLKANQNRRPKFVFFHKSFWITPLREGRTDFPFHRLAKQYGVDHVISGHGHQFVRMRRDGIVYMQVGSSGANMLSHQRKWEGFAQGRFYHYVWATVKGSRAEFTVKEIDGASHSGRMFRAEDWDENGPKFDPADPAVTDKPET